MIFLSLCVWIFIGKSKSVVNGSNFDERAEGIEEKQVSFEMDPSEIPSSYESEEEEEEEEEEGLSKHLDSWQIPEPDYVEERT